MKEVLIQKQETKKQKSHIIPRTSHNSGITLVALIITVIVLLILAVVAIQAVQNDGIISHAKNAQTEYEKAQAEEQSRLEGYLGTLEADKVATTMEEAQSNKMLSKTVNSTLTDKYGNKIVVPAGFKILVDNTTDYTSDTIDVTKGIVIQDGIGNEFVWIPVDNINSMAKVTSGTDANGRTNYQGVLYNFTSKGATEQTNYGQGTECYREPDNLSSYDSTSEMSIWTPTLYQESFNRMVESVAKYGGFYVGRYETSLNGTTAQSKAGETPMNKISWYRTYENSKTYSSSNTALGVESEMIWGCQWDAMLKYILTTTDASHVTATTNVSHDLSSVYKTGGTDYSGSYNDKSANIYDLEGNVREWTQEADLTDRRVYRGGAYNTTGRSPSDRNGYGDGPKDGTRGSRLSLYIK